MTYKLYFNMITVFFHLLFLLGKYVYKKHHEGSLKNPEEIAEKEAAYSHGCEMENPIVFTPPAYLQRYNAVRDAITDCKYARKIRKIVDFGCAELGLFPHLKQVLTIEEMLFVDIDRGTLDTYKKKIEPFTADYLNMRSRPLKVSIYEGSVTDNDKILENTDAVICIELIEHLYPETLRNVPGNIFGFIKPQIAIITTPNADFNVLFEPKDGFRHADHKFEWTRAEFEKWAQDIVDKYPEYEVTFQGICPGPKGTEEYGCCSQMAVFQHRRELELPRTCGVEGLFQFVSQIEYPFKVDNRSDEEKILDDASYSIKKYQANSGNDKMPLEHLAKVMEKPVISLEFLQDVLENGGFAITQNQRNETCVVCPPVEDYDVDPGDDLFDGTLYEDAVLGDHDIADDYEPPLPYPTHWTNDDIDENWDDDYEEIDPVTIIINDPINTGIFNLNLQISDTNNSGDV